jgi:hypothetical protein
MSEDQSQDLYQSIFEDLIIEMGQAGYFFLGEMDDPQSGDRLIDLESAKSIVDQLEMLVEKTNGNLTGTEAELLNGTLTNLRDRLADKIDDQENSRDKSS